LDTLKTSNNRGLPQYIFLVGPDGSGKSTLAKLLVQELGGRGLDAKRGWSRYNNYVSKPLLALARLVGFNYYEEKNGYLHGYHDFHKSRMISLLFTLLQGIDVNIATYLRIVRSKRHTEILVCDRGPFDTLIDVMIDTGHYDLGKGLFFYIYLWFVKNSSKFIVLERSFDNIVKTKREVKYDRKILEKIELYNYYSKYLGWPLVDNNKNIENTFMEIKEILGIRI